MPLRQDPERRLQRLLRKEHADVFQYLDTLQEEVEEAWATGDLEHVLCTVASHGRALYLLWAQHEASAAPTKKLSKRNILGPCVRVQRA